MAPASQVPLRHPEPSAHFMGTKIHGRLAKMWPKRANGVLDVPIPKEATDEILRLLEWMKSCGWAKNPYQLVQDFVHAQYV